MIEIFSAGLSSAGFASETSGFEGAVEGAAATLDPNAKGPAPEIPGAKKGGTLTVPYSSTPANMDPSDQFYQDTAVIYSLTH